MPAPTLSTPRLRLRPWIDADLEPFAAMNADPRVMEYFASTFTREESDALSARIRAGLAANDFGFWAVERLAARGFVGFVGLSVPSFTAHFTPCVEIGWRLLRAHWGNGYATEAASAALTHAFGPLGLDEVVAFTAVANARSQAVMRRLGMTRTQEDDFLHPRLSLGHRLRPHVLYRLRRQVWESRIGIEDGP